MVALYSMLSDTYFAHKCASIIGRSLLIIENFDFRQTNNICWCSRLTLIQGASQCKNINRLIQNENKKDVLDVASNVIFVLGPQLVSR